MKVHNFYLKPRKRGLDLRTVPPNRDVFCKGYDDEEKVDLSKGYWNPERKMRVTTHFSEITKQP